MEDGSKYTIILTRNFRFRTISFLFSLSIVSLLITGFLFKNNHIFIIIFLLFIFSIYFFYVMHKIASQIIIVGDATLHCKLPGEDMFTINYCDITLAGLYKKSFENTKFGFNEGFYIYNENIDRFFLISADFFDYKKMYEELKQKCELYCIHRIDIKKVKNRTLSSQIAEQLTFNEV